MIECTLPNYCPERYYLLSEIEQRASFVIIDESPTLAIGEGSLGVVYLLWNVGAGNSEKELKQKIKRIFSNSVFKPSRFIVSIEALIRTRDIYPETKSTILALLDWYHEEYPSGCMVVGVSDSKAGTPALERCLELLQLMASESMIAQAQTEEVEQIPDDEEAVKEVLLASGKLLFIADTRQDCMGHDPLREPDAAADVFQRICYKSAELYEPWVFALISEAKRVYTQTVAASAAAGSSQQGRLIGMGSGSSSSNSGTSMLLIGISGVVLMISITFMYFTGARTR